MILKNFIYLPMCTMSKLFIFKMSKYLVILKLLYLQKFNCNVKIYVVLLKLKSFFKLFKFVKNKIKINLKKKIK